MNRREFMMSAAAGAVLAGTKVSFAGASGARIVKRDAPARFEVVTARGVVKETKGASVTWDVSPKGNCTGPGVDVFARVKAYAADGCGEVLFSQPFMLY